MPVDLSQVAAQLSGLAAKLKTEGTRHNERLQYALNLLRDTNAAALQGKIEASRDGTPWPVALLDGDISTRFGVSSCPADFTVIATDGSHIEVDRHSSVRCYLINIGRVVLRYGSSPDAWLDSEASLFFGDDLTITDPAGRVELVEGALLGVKRAIEEIRSLSQMASESPNDASTLALVDGSLVLWGLSPRDCEGYIKDELLNKQYLGAFDLMKQVSKGGSFALAGYISFPRSADVVNALRVAICPHDIADCERSCSGGRQRACDAIAGVQDSDLFDIALEPGQRSATFSSGSKFVQNYYGEHRVHFFYIKTEEEVARVEIPQWIAEHGDLVELVHALVLDQCRRGHGYPVALMEAHEKAVVTAADRGGFRLLLERALVGEGVEVKTSGKSRSKRLRWV
jgi:hypothetical protein